MTVGARPGWLLPTMAGYRRGWARDDAIAGATAAAVVIPQALAYATLAGLPVQVGLYTCIVPMAVYALLGGSGSLSVSSTSTVATLTGTTLVSASVTATAVETGVDPARALASLGAIVGVVLVAAALLRLGGIVENVSHPVLVGVQASIGLTVALGQMPKLMGVAVDTSALGWWRSVRAVVAAAPDIAVPTALLGGASVLALFLLAHNLPRIPAALFVSVAGAVAVAATSATVDLIAAVPSGLPVPVMPALDQLGPFVPGGLAIAVLVFLESSVVARSVRRPTEPLVDNDRELRALGVANLAGALLQSLPAGGGFSQGAVNRAAGARSQLAALVTAGLAVLVALLLAPLVSRLPQASLAAVVFISAVGLVKVSELLHLARVARREFWLAMTTVAAGLAAGLLAGVTVGVTLTVLVLLRDLNRPRFDVTRPTGDELTVTLRIPLYAVNVQGTRDALIALVHDDPRIRTVTLDLAVQ